MKLQVTGHQIDIGESLGDYAKEHTLSIVEKYFQDAVDGMVVFSKNGHLIHTEVLVHVGRGIEVKGDGESDEHYRSFDIALGRVEKKLRRYKNRLKDHHNKHSDAQERKALQYILSNVHQDEDEAEKEYQPPIIAEVATQIPTLTVGEAVMRMDLSNDSVLLFYNKSHGGLNAIHMRKDGNIGWVDPEGNQGLKKA